MNENSQNSLRQISETEVKEMLEAHSQWLGSGGVKGDIELTVNHALEDSRSAFAVDVELIIPQPDPV